MEALEGEFHTTQRAGNYVGGMIIWSGAAFWYFWKSLNRRGWVGALVGMAISLLVLFGGAGISGYVKGQRADILDQVPQFAALKRNFPEAAEQVRQDLRTMSKDKSQNRQELATILQKRVAPAFNSALKTTSDTAMVQLTKAKVRQFEEVAKANANDCVVLTSGRLADQPPEGQARIIASTSKATAEALRDAMVKVLNDADAHRSEPSLPDKNRFNVLYEQLDAKLKSGHGTSAYYFSDESSKAPADIKCKAGILVFSEALTLPEKDRRFMLTTFFSPE